MWFILTFCSCSHSHQCNSCQKHHAVVSGFTVDELMAMLVIQTVLPLHRTVDNGHFIGPGSPLSILPLELPHRHRHRVVPVSVPISLPTTPIRPPLPIRVPPEVIDLTHEPRDDEHYTTGKKNRGRASLPAIPIIIEVSDEETLPEPRQPMSCRSRTSLPIARDAISVHADLQGKVAILYFAKVYHYRVSGAGI